MSQPVDGGGGLAHQTWMVEEDGGVDTRFFIWWAMILCSS